MNNIFTLNFTTLVKITSPIFMRRTSNPLFISSLPLNLIARSIPLFSRFLFKNYHIRTHLALVIFFKIFKLSKIRITL
jgi:hypothetical protein